MSVTETAGFARSYVRAYAYPHVPIRCEIGHCADADSRLYEQLSSGAYDECAVMALPGSIDEWRAGHRTARKRSDRAFRRGYSAGMLRRERFAEDIHEINVSASVRQGRPMDRSYRERKEFSPLPHYRCARHAIRTTGVWAPDGHLVAYLTMHRAGDLALVSQILGHAAHLENEVMYLLFECALGREVAADPDGLVVYNRWDSGTSGLQFFKERLGFERGLVEWLP